MKKAKNKIQMAVPPPTVPSVVQGPEQLEISMPIEVRNQGKTIIRENQFMKTKAKTFKTTLFIL